jgi:hypothetical protein
MAIEERTQASAGGDAGSGLLASHDPATGELIGTVTVTPPEDIERIAG